MCQFLNVTKQEANYQVWTEQLPSPGWVDATLSPGSLLFTSQGPEEERPGNEVGVDDHCLEGF